jgi:hypothetical protein
MPEWSVRAAQALGHAGGRMAASLATAPERVYSEATCQRQRRGNSAEKPRARQRACAVCAAVAPPRAPEHERHSAKSGQRGTRPAVRRANSEFWNRAPIRTNREYRKTIPSLTRGRSATKCSGLGLSACNKYLRPAAVNGRHRNGDMRSRSGGPRESRHRHEPSTNHPRRVRGRRTVI